MLVQFVFRGHGGCARCNLQCGIEPQVGVVPYKKIGRDSKRNHNGAKEGSEGNGQPCRKQSMSITLYVENKYAINP
jgi:hypothetical protein